MVKYKAPKSRNPMARELTKPLYRTQIVDSKLKHEAPGHKIIEEEMFLSGYDDDDLDMKE